MDISCLVNIMKTYGTNMIEDDDDDTQVYKKAWVGLTDEDKKEYIAQDFGGSRIDAMDWTEKRLKEKNT